MKELSAQEATLVINVLMLATVLDGRARKREMELLADAIEMCSSAECPVVLNETHVKLLAQRTRNMFPLQLEDIQDILKAVPTMEIPKSFQWNECTHKCSSMLAC